MKNELGIGRLLIAVYTVFAVSASARAIFQITTKFQEAPLAYSLSALAAIVYLVASVLMAKDSWRKLASYALWFELIGVLVVGTLSLALPEHFNHPTVWSNFGMGYGFVPLVLPFLGILWLRRANARTD